MTRTPTSKGEMNQDEQSVTHVRNGLRRFRSAGHGKGPCKNKSVVLRRNFDILPGSVIGMEKVEEC
jgi:hypothetical protein